MKKILAISIAFIMFLGSSVTAHALDGYTDFITSNDGLHHFDIVGHANCSFCVNCYAALYVCSDSIAVGAHPHYLIACNRCGTTVEYNDEYDY